MKQFHLFVLSLIFATIFFASCDDGRIYDDKTGNTTTGTTLKFTGKLQGSDLWDDGYTLALAVFGKDNEYAINAKNISATSSDAETTVILSGITDAASTVELCVINRLRERVVSFASIDYKTDEDTIIMNVGEMNVGLHSAIQQTIFNTTCVHCHSANAQEGVAYLSLTAENSYDALVGKESRKKPGEYLVKPGEPANSVIYSILKNDAGKDWRYDHGKEVLNGNRMTLLENWIKCGAPR